MKISRIKSVEPSPSDNRGLPANAAGDSVSADAARALFGGEQLAFEDLGGQCLGVEGHERLIPSGPVLMDGAGDLPLARSRLADDQHRGRRTRGQTNLLEQPAMGRAQAEQAVESPLLLELAPDLEKLDVQPICLRCRERWAGHPGSRTTPSRPINVSCWSRNGQNSTLRQIRSPPAWKISAVVPAGWPASDSGGGWKLAARSARSSRAGRSMGVTGQAHDRLERVAGQRFPGLIDPGEPELGVEPEGRLARLLPELRGLELARAWMRHETMTDSS